MNRTTRRLALEVWTGFVVLLAPSVPAGAQHWELEIHGGAVRSSAPTTGLTSLPPVGDSFMTFGGGRLSRRVASWYFGDGSAMLNEAIAEWAPSSGRKILPLDPVLQKPVLERPNGRSVGFRLGRSLNARMGGRSALTTTSPDRG